MQQANMLAASTAGHGLPAGPYLLDGSALGARVYSVQFEQEADYAALYVMRRAGYDLAGVAEFWRRIAAQDTRQISLHSTHSTTAERFVAIETALKEIAAKEQAGQPLAPNAKTPLGE